MGGRQSSSREEIRSINQHLAASVKTASEEQHQSTEETSRLRKELQRLSKVKNEQTTELREQRRALEGWRNDYDKVEERLR